MARVAWFHFSRNVVILFRSWGVFERPADISAAYGGGKQIGVGGYQPSEAEKKAAIEETKAKLAAFRKAAGKAPRRDYFSIVAPFIFS